MDFLIRIKVKQLKSENKNLICIIILKVKRVEFHCYPLAYTKYWRSGVESC